MRTGILAALTLVLAPRIDIAILVGVSLSLGIHAWREMRPRVDIWIDGDEFHIRPWGVLWFGSTPALEQELLERLPVEDDAPDIVVIHLGGLGRIDLTGALGLKQLREDARVAGLETRFVEVPPHAERILRSVLGPTEEEPAGHADTDTDADHPPA